MAAGVKPPVWFWIVAFVLVLWNAMGCYQCYLQWTLGSAAWHDPDPAWAAAYYAKLPAWYNYCYVVATFGGLLASLALLLREKRAVILAWISLIAIVVMFGYTFAATDMLAKKGAAVAVPFPLVIAAIGIFVVWFSKLATTKGWLGR